MFLVPHPVPRLISANDQLCQLHLHVQRIVGALKLQHQDAVGIAENAWRLAQ